MKKQHECKNNFTLGAVVGASVMTSVYVAKAAFVIFCYSPTAFKYGDKVWVGGGGFYSLCNGTVSLKSPYRNDRYLVNLTCGNTPVGLDWVDGKDMHHDH